MPGIFAVGSDNSVTVTGLVDHLGVAIDGTAVVSGRVVDSDEGTVEVPHSAFLFTYDGTPGQFTGILRAAAQLRAGHEYRLVVEFIVGGRIYAVSEVRSAMYVE